MVIHKTFGLDLGTTNSTIAIYKDGDFIFGLDGKDKIIPSIVANDGNKFIVGKAAKINTTLKEKIHSIKRMMGKDNDFVTLNNVHYSPEQISSEIIKHCAKLLNDQVHDNSIYDQAVITVPAYFNIAQKNATVKAGELAGLKVKLLLEEPSSAAIRYYVENNIQNGVYMVYDLGGGTFDVSIVEKIDNTPIVLATAGNNFLGGNNFDRILAHYFLDYINNELGYDIELDIENNSNDKRKFDNLVLYAENIKKTLSNQESVNICRYDVFQDNSGIDLIIDEFTREDFEKLINDKIEIDTVVECEKALEKFKNSGRSLNEIDSILLVGGSSHLPLVRKVIEKKYIKSRLIKKVEVFEPELAVATGASIIAATMPILVTDENFEVEIDMPYICEDSTIFSGRILKGDIEKVGIVTSKEELVAEVSENNDFNLIVDSKDKVVEYVLYSKTSQKYIINSNIDSQNFISPTPVQNETIRIEIVDLEKNEIVNFPIVKEGESLPCEATHNFKINKFSKDKIVLPVKEGYREIYKLVAATPSNVSVGSRVTVTVKIDTLGNIDLKMLLDNHELNTEVIKAKITRINSEEEANLDKEFEEKVSNFKDSNEKEVYENAAKRYKRELDEAERNKDTNHYEDTLEKYRSLVQEMPQIREDITVEDFETLKKEILTEIETNDVQNINMTHIENTTYLGIRAVKRGDMGTAKERYDELKNIKSYVDLKSNPYYEFQGLMFTLVDINKSIELLDDPLQQSNLTNDLNNLFEYMDTLNIPFDNLHSLSKNQMKTINEKIIFRARPLFNALASTNVEEVSKKYKEFEGRLSKD